MENELYVEQCTPQPDAVVAVAAVPEIEPLIARTAEGGDEPAPKRMKIHYGMMALDWCRAHLKQETAEGWQFDYEGRYCTCRLVSTASSGS